MKLCSYVKGSVKLLLCGLELCMHIISFTPGCLLGILSSISLCDQSLQCCITRCNLLTQGTDSLLLVANLLHNTQSTQQAWACPFCIALHYVLSQPALQVHQDTMVVKSGGRRHSLLTAARSLRLMLISASCCCSWLICSWCPDATRRRLAMVCFRC